MRIGTERSLMKNPSPMASGSDPLWAKLTFLLIHIALEKMGHTLRPTTNIKCWYTTYDAKLDICGAERWPVRTEQREGTKFYRKIFLAMDNLKKRV
jgi:hypothetical protein